MPRSSIPTWTPSPCSAAITRRAIVRLSSGWRSVTSSSTWLSAIGEPPKILRTSVTIASSMKCRADRLKPILNCGRRADRRARLVAHAPHQGARQLDDQPARFGERNEVDRRHQRSVRLAPAHQHFGAHHPRSREIDDRLVIRNELAVIDRARKLVGRVAARPPRPERDQRKNERGARTGTDSRHHDEIAVAGERPRARHRRRDQDTEALGLEARDQRLKRPGVIGLRGAAGADHCAVRGGKDRVHRDRPAVRRNTRDQQNPRESEHRAMNRPRDRAADGQSILVALAEPRITSITISLCALSTGAEITARCASGKREVGAYRGAVGIDHGDFLHRHNANDISFMASRSASAQESTPRAARSSGAPAMTRASRACISAIAHFADT